MQSHRFIFISWSVLLLIVLMVLYWPSFAGPYIFDDQNNVETNRSIESFPPKLNWHRPEARAVVLFTFAFDRQLWGDSPLGHRIGNVVVHWMAAVFLAALACNLVRTTDRLTAEFTLCLFAATLWAVHPLNSQAVAYIVQRFESMMGMFFFAYLFSITMQDRAETKRGKLGWIVAAFACFVLGLWSKTIMITAIAVGPLMDRAWLCDSWRQVLSRRGWLYVPPILLGGLAAVSLLPGLIRGTANVGFGGETGPVDLYLAAQAEVIPAYIGQLLFPAGLNLDHGVLGPDSVSSQVGWIALMLLIVSAGIWLQLTGRVQAAFFVLSPLLVLSPSSSFIPTLDLMVEHRMYVPSAFVIAGIVWAAAKLWGSFRKDAPLAMTASRMRLVMGAVLILITAVYAARTYVRAGDYLSGIRIWQLSLIHNPVNPRAAQNMIDEALSVDVQDVIPFFEVPVRAAASSGQWDGVLKGRVAEELVKLGETDHTIPILTSVIESAETDRLLDRRFLRFDVRQELASHHINLAIGLSQLGRYEAALSSLEEAFKIDDRSPDARAIAGETAAKLSRFDDARMHYRRALELRPDWVDVRRSLKQIEEHLDQ